MTLLNTWMSPFRIHFVSPSIFPCCQWKSYRSQPTKPGGHCHKYGGGKRWEMGRSTLSLAGNLVSTRNNLAVMEQGKLLLIDYSFFPL